MDKPEQITEQIDEGLLYWKTDPQGEWIVATYDYILKRYVNINNEYAMALTAIQEFLDNTDYILKGTKKNT